MLTDSCSYWIDVLIGFSNCIQSRTEVDGVDEEGEEDDGGEEDEKGLDNHRISGAAENTWYSRASSVRDQSAIKDDAKLEWWFGSDLLRASAEVLGKGSVGTSYKAVLEEGTTVVVKRLKDVVVTKIEFEVQMEGLGKVNHENIVPLRAFYYSKDEKLLVYDFMPAGSLSALFFWVSNLQTFTAMEILEMRNVKVSRFKQWSSLEEMRNV
ncbi:hypothetical protein Scep_016337 [Stephania cephalantha]|uniref:Protein kinase domain-containing protein n=1 Tax=Stephania cephalantha TaxID=152367 RepID=A0AAP0IMF6_9MAGN